MRALVADPTWIDAHASAATFLASHGVETHRRRREVGLLVTTAFEKDWAAATPF